MSEEFLESPGVEALLNPASPNKTIAKIWGKTLSSILGLGSSSPGTGVRVGANAPCMTLPP
jgi:hypothetical protein